MPEECVSFSVKSAQLAVEELFGALPKTQRALYLGSLNEVLVVLGRLAGFFTVPLDAEKTEQAINQKRVDELMSDWLEGFVKGQSSE